MLSRVGVSSIGQDSICRSTGNDCDMRSMGSDDDSRMRRQVVLSRLGIVAIDACMAVSFLLAWAWAWERGPFAVMSMNFVLVLEFLTIHASGFFLMALMRRKLNRILRVLLVLLIGAVYTALLASLGWSYGVWWPAAAMALLVYDKLALTLRIARSATDLAPALRKFAGIEWALRFLLFMMAGLLAIALPWPALGTVALDPAITRPEELADHVLLVHGTLYFLLCAAVRYRAIPRLRQHCGI